MCYVSSGISRMWAVWIALLLWAAPTQGVSTNCEIPAVEKLQNTSLTCKFSEDISKQKQDFEVHFYKNNTTDSSETILRCYWMDNKLECRVHNCCEYDRHVNETLTLRVLSVTDTRVGRYVCFVLPAAPDGNNFCNFTLREKITDASGGNLAVLAVLIVIPVIIFVLIVWRLKCSKKVEEKTTKKETCHFWIGQWCSAQEKPGDRESKQPLNESKDEANDHIHSRDRSTDEDLHSTHPKAGEKLGRKSDNIDRPQRSEHTSFIGRLGTLFGSLFRREPVNRNAEFSCTPQQEPSIDEGTRSTKESSQSLSGNELQTENETKDKKTQKSDIYKYTSNITKEGRKARSVRKIANEKEKEAQEKAEIYEKIAKDKAEKEIKSAREKAEQEEKLVKEYAEKEEAIAKGKAEELEKMAKETAEREKRMANDKAKKEEKIAKDKAEKEEEIAKRTSKKMANTVANLEESVKKISNEKEEQMTKIAKSKEQQMEIIAKEKEEQLEKIAKEKREELEKIANAREKQLQEISKRREEEIENIKKKKKEEIEKIRKVKAERMETIINKKEKKIEEIKKKKEKQSKGKVQESDELSQIKETEDDACRVELVDETDPFLATKNSNIQVLTRNQNTTDTIIQMSELVSLQDTSEAPTRTPDQTLQAVDKVGTPVKQKNNEDDEGTRSTKESSQSLSGNELQTENETKDKKTQKSDIYKYTTNITKEGRKARSVRKIATEKEKEAQEKAEIYEKIAKYKAEKEIKSAREKAEKEEKLVKEYAEKEEATAKGKAEELETMAKETAEREERMANDKAKKEEKIAKYKAEKEEEIAKWASKKKANTAANIEEKVKKISNEKEEQMKKIAKRKEEQMEIIAKEKEEQLKKIAKEKEEELEKIANAKEEELEKIANAKEKRLEEISNRNALEMEKIKKRKEEVIEKIRKVKEDRMERIKNKKEKRFEEIKKKKEKQSQEKGKGKHQIAVRESVEVQGNDEQLQINGTEDDAYEVDNTDETDPCLDTNNSNVQVNPATRSQSAPHTIIQMSQLASHQDTSEAPTGTQNQRLQAVDKVGTPVKNKTNEDKASNKNASTERNCTVS